MLEHQGAAPKGIALIFFKRNTVSFSGVYGTCTIVEAGTLTTVVASFLRGHCCTMVSANTAIAVGNKHRHWTVYYPWFLFSAAGVAVQVADCFRCGGAPVAGKSASN